MRTITANKTLVVVIFFSLTIAITLFLAINEYLYRGKGHKMMLNVWVFEPPTSADPIDFDAFVHHVTFRPIFSGLVSQYKKGVYVGVLAESWMASTDFKRWEFKIKKNLQFSNNDPITPQVIYKSLTRTALLMAKKGSHSDLFNNLTEYVAPQNCNSSIPGISIENEKLIFTFENSNPRLLEQLSFGLYSVLHPSQYNNQTGEFNNKDIISSGPYFIRNWSDSELNLSLRHSFPIESRHARAFSDVAIRWDDTSKKFADLVVSFHSDSGISERLTFYGPSKSNIIYLHCLSWHKKGSICSDADIRLTLRNGFYNYLKSQNIDFTTSFFPLHMAGIKELDYDALSPITYDGGGKSLIIRLRATTNIAYPLLKKALVDYFKSLNVNAKIEDDISYSDLGPYLNKEKNDVDFSAVVTGILVEDPFGDIRFMFRSKEGIRLPDTNGKILSSLDKIEPQHVNQELFNQAVIWPLLHTSMGIWVGDRVDISELNTLIPPTDFAWIAGND